MTFNRSLLAVSMLTLSQFLSLAADTLVYDGGSGLGQGKHIVFLVGDEEYRSEEGLPMIARILAARHGFKCTVLFTINPADGTIDPMNLTNLPGLEALQTADLCFMKLRFRELPDSDMKHFVDYVNSGKPLIALRTSTHAFAYNRNKESQYARWDWRNKEWPGGFGQQVLGETWVNHHGTHGKESTRGVINKEYKDHPLLKGVSEIWGPTDVYTVAHLPKDAQVLVWGQVLTGMKREDPPETSGKNDPMMPLAWTRQYRGEQGKTSTIVTTTMGAAVDLEDENLRRLLVNACYWAVGLGDKIPAKPEVSYVGDYKPSWFGYGKFKQGVKPSDLQLSSLPPPAGKTHLSYAADIKPIFERSCVKCHGEDRPKARLRLDSLEAALKGGESGKVIKPGDGAGSMLVRSIAHLGDEEHFMPPPGNKAGIPPLDKEQIALIRAWIDQGAN